MFFPIEGICNFINEVDHGMGCGVPTTETKLLPTENVIFVKKSKKSSCHILLHDFRKCA